MKTDVYQRITNSIVAELERACARGSNLGTANMPPAA